MANSGSTIVDEIDAASSNSGNFSSAAHRYAEAIASFNTMSSSSSQQALDAFIQNEMPGLVSQIMVDEYAKETSGRIDCVEFNHGAYDYIFDLALERTVGVFGFSARPSAKRDSAYQAGHPSYRQGFSGRDSAGNIVKAERRDIGHLMSDRQGGALGPNVVPQRTDINQRRRSEPLSYIWAGIEKYCRSKDGVFSFARPSYAPGNVTVDPERIEYGLVYESKQFRVMSFPNR